MKRRRDAWAFGREQCSGLLRQYEQKYGNVDAPPALLIHELIPEFLGAKVRYHPLPTDRFAETGFVDDELQVTVNSELLQIEGVKDGPGVENVALWHEAIHVIRDTEALVRPATAPLPGFEEPPVLICRRGTGSHAATSSSIAEREFWAEEAGRAAAVSIDVLRRTGPFVEFLHAAKSARGPVRGGFPMLYDAAKAIGVNISALVKQLTIEGLIVIARDGERRVVYGQPSLLDGEP